MEKYEFTKSELVGIVAHIRDNEEYKEKVDKLKNKTILNEIIHHSQSEKNKFYGDWTEETKNYVIHQVINRVLSKDERDKLLKEHPLLKKINEIEDHKKKSEYCNFQFFNKLKSNFYEINKLKTRLEKVETTDVEQFIDNEIKYQILIRHYEENFVKPMITYGWVDKKFTLPRAIDPNISENTRNFIIENNMIDTLQYDFPHKSYYYDIINIANERGEMNIKYQDKIKELIKENKKLKEENYNIRKDRDKLIKEI